MIYKVWIQVEEIDESKDHYLNIGEPIEAGKFDTKTEAGNYIENELLLSRRLRPWIISFVIICAILFVLYLVYCLLAEGFGL